MIQEAIEAAGVPVLAFKVFGSYQGDWIAKVPGGYITGSYGSCSGCDAFEAEMGYVFYDDPYNYQSRLAAFGANYVEQIETADQVRDHFRPSLQWDTDAPSIFTWLDEQESN